IGVVAVVVVVVLHHVVSSHHVSSHGMRRVHHLAHGMLYDFWCYDHSIDRRVAKVVVGLLRVNRYSDYVATRYCDFSIYVMYRTFSQGYGGSANDRRLIALCYAWFKLRKIGYFVGMLCRTIEQRH